MNCQSCNTEIDYRFVTNCAHCDVAVQPQPVSQLQSLPDPPPIEQRLSWTRRIANLVYLVVTAFAGMVSGTVVLFTVGAIVMKIVFDFVDPHPPPGKYCGIGNAIGFMLLYSGAFLGTITGSVLAVKRPLCKTPIH